MEKKTNIKILANTVEKQLKKSKKELRKATNQVLMVARRNALKVFLIRIGEGEIENQKCSIKIFENFNSNLLVRGEAYFKSIFKYADWQLFTRTPNLQSSITSNSKLHL